MSQPTSLAAGGRIIIGCNGLSTNQVNIPVTAGGTLLLAENLGRRVVKFRNLDASNPVYVGEGPTVATTTGMLIKGGEDRDFIYTGAFYAISTGGTVAVAYADQYTA